MSALQGDFHLTAKPRLLKQCASLKSQEQAILDRVSTVTPDYQHHPKPALLSFTIGRASQPQISVPMAALHGIRPDVLRRYLRWLAITKALEGCEHLFGQTSHPLHNSCTWAQCRHLIDSYVLGGRVHDSEYQRYILQELDSWTLPEPGADIEVLQLVMRSEELGSQLRDFVIERTFCDEEGVEDILKLLLGNRDEKESCLKTTHRNSASQETPVVPLVSRDSTTSGINPGNGAPLDYLYAQEFPYSKSMPALPPEAPSSLNLRHTIAACDVGLVRRENWTEPASLRKVRSRSFGELRVVPEHIQN